MKTKEKIIENGLYQLPHKYSGHCKHGLAVASKHGGLDKPMLFDTYWGKSDTFYDPENIDGEIIFLLDMNHAKRVDQRVWEQYDPGSKAFIPIGGGSEQWLVDDRAKPLVSLQIGQLESEITQFLTQIEYKVRKVKMKRHEIAKLREEPIDA